jgi:nitrogen PTS system EIIA component
MQLTVREVARLWQVSENVVYGWVRDGGLPAERLNDQYRFNRAELLEWATLRKMSIPQAFFQLGNGYGLHLDEALQAGGIFHDVKGANKEAVLRSVVEAMPLPANCDRAFLLQVFLSRESLGSTGVGDGLALPHPRYPMVLPIERPFITVNFLEQPIPYASADGKPVHTLFALLSPTVHTHLKLLARLSCGLQDPEFRAAIKRRAPAEEILRHAHRIEADFARPETKVPAEAH